MNAEIREKVRRFGAAVWAAVAGWAIPYMLETSAWTRGLLLLSIVPVTVVFFWPELRRLRFVDEPKKRNAPPKPSSSPGWPMVVLSAALFAICLQSGWNFYTALANEPTNLTPLDVAQPHFNGISFYLTDFARLAPETRIAGKTFENCTVYGPAVIFLRNHTAIRGATFEANACELFVDLAEEGYTRTGGIIDVSDTTFRNCVFKKNIQIAVVPALKQKWIESNNIWGGGTECLTPAAGRETAASAPADRQPPGP